jgi:cell division protein FtsW
MSASFLNSTTASIKGLGLRGRLARVMDVDQGMLAGILSLSMIGIIIVASSSVVLAEHYTGDSMYFLKRHLVNVGFACVAAMIGWFTPLYVWEKLSRSMLLVAIALLIAVLMPGIGLEVKGAQRWINLGVMNLQVTEVARVAMLVYFAGFVVRHADSVSNRLSGLLAPCIALAICGGLIAMQPDLGSVILMAAVCFTILFVGGIPLRWVVMMVVLFVGTAILLTVTEEYRLARVLSFWNPDADSLGAGYQTQQAFIAIGRGGWFGVGLGRSLQKFLYVPEMHTDYVFAVFAEEFGLAAVLALIALYAYLLFKGWSVGNAAAKNHQWFAAYLCLGITVALALQVIVHIAVNVGYAPPTGAVLPFMSYGGSSLLMTGATTGMLLRASSEVRAKNAETSEAAGGDQ